MIKAIWPLIFGGSKVKVPQKSGTPTFNHLFIGPLSTLPEKFIKTCFQAGFVNKQTLAVTGASLVEVIKQSCFKQAVSGELSRQAVSPNPPFSPDSGCFHKSRTLRSRAETVLLLFVIDLGNQME